MKMFKWLPLLLVVMMLFVSACSTTATNNQSSTDQEPEPVAQAEPQATDPAPAAQPQADDQAGKYEFINTHVYFDFDSAVLQPEAQDLLRAKAQWLQDNPGVAAIVIEGHCDERGTDAYNLALGARRAEAVKSYLSNMGVNAIELTTQSYGEEKPINTASNEAAWAMNRRAAFVLD